MSDDSFRRLVECDIALVFSDKDSDSSSSNIILLFPSLLSRFRFLLHEYVQSHYPTLSTRSFGEGDCRRTSVYPSNLELSCSKLSSPRPADSMSTKPDLKSASRKSARPTVQSYVPPALRNKTQCAPSPHAQDGHRHVPASLRNKVRTPSPSSNAQSGQLDQVVKRTDKDSVVSLSDRMKKELHVDDSVSKSDHPNGSYFARTLTAHPADDSPKKNPETAELEDRVLKELTDAFGDAVTIKQAQNSYDSYSPSSSRSSSSWSSGYAHVLEVYNFPTSWTTADVVSDLQAITKDFFELVWVDLSHALAAFASEAIARKVLSNQSPLLRSKLRPFSEASEAAIKKARTDIPFQADDGRQRPATSAAAARRLVAGALGLKIDVPKEKRDLERNRLKEAKQSKERLKQQMEDVWEGRI